MEASMHGFGSEGRADVVGRRAARRTPRGWSGTDAKSTVQPGRRAPRSAGRLEHALFALLLGCLGYFWLGALLAEATQAL